jgi:hypothetical protein
MTPAGSTKKRYRCRFLELKGFDTRYRMSGEMISKHHPTIDEGDFFITSPIHRIDFISSTCETENSFYRWNPKETKL